MFRFPVLAALLAGCALLPVSSTAQLSFQSHQIAQNSGFSVHGDFNGDGREDIVAEIDLTGNYVLYLSNGDGTYKAPVALPAPVDAIGDFNHDGKLDFVSFHTGNKVGPVAVYLGNGDGTFQSPKVISGSSALFIAAADVNHDNKTDLVTVTYTSNGTGYPTTIQLWLSNGDGTFSKGQSITTTNPADSVVELTQVVAGDFDGDGKPDIALIYTFIGPTTVQVWYGDGAGHLGPSYAITNPDGYIGGPFTVADVNNDGRSDIISNVFIPSGRYGSTQGLPYLTLYTGNANRTLGYSTLATNQCAGGITVADFNGDGLNDLAYNESACDLSSANSTVVIREGEGSGSFGSEDTVAQSVNGGGTPYAIRTTTGTRPDLVFNQITSSTSSNPSIFLLTNTSTGNFPGCGLTGIAEGVQICSPGTSAASPVKFSVAAAGPTPMRTAAVWVDGKKVAEQLTHAFSNYSFLDASLTLSAGSHAITIFGTGWDDTLQEKSFTLTVGGSTSCSAPTSAGVHICQPASGATVTSPVQIQAASTITGKFDRIEVWVDGVKKYTETSSTTLSTTLALAAGSHRFGIFAVNTAGTKWEQVVYATVK